MAHGRVSILLLCGLFFGCERKPKEGFPDLIEVTAISTLTDPMEGPYPNGASVCLCRNQKGEKILVALPAFKDRKILSNYRKITTGSMLNTKLIPWQERPAAARTMHFANDFRDEFDLRLFYTESFSVD